METIDPKKEEVQTSGFSLSSIFASLLSRSAEPHKAITIESFEKVYEAYKDLKQQQDYSAELKKQALRLMKVLTLDKSEFKARFIIWHFALYLSGSVDENGEYVLRHYSPLYRQFLFRFLNELFPHIRAKKLLQIFDKSLGSIAAEHHLGELDANHYDPISSVVNRNFLAEGIDNVVDYLKFTDYMHRNSKEFEEYISQTLPPFRLGETSDKRYPESKQVLETRNLVLQNSRNLVDYSNETLKCQFELISPKCRYGRHVVITVSGFLSEKDDHSQAWVALCEANSTLPVYNYRWASKNTLDMLSPLINYGNFSNFVVNGLLKKAFALYNIASMVGQYREIFVHAVNIAKLSGKLLAHALMMQFPFRNQSISLVGFSLGTQVICS